MKRWSLRRPPPPIDIPLSPTGIDGEGGLDLDDDPTERKTRAINGSRSTRALMSPQVRVHFTYACFEEKNQLINQLDFMLDEIVMILAHEFSSSYARLQAEAMERGVNSRLPIDSMDVRRGSTRIAPSIDGRQSSRMYGLEDDNLGRRASALGLDDILARRRRSTRMQQRESVDFTRNRRDSINARERRGSYRESMGRRGSIKAFDLESQYLAVFGEVKRRSPFELWPREALIDVLILNGIELRHERDLEHGQLVNICNKVRVCVHQPQKSQTPGFATFPFLFAVHVFTPTFTINHKHT